MRPIRHYNRYSEIIPANRLINFYEDLILWHL
uniref:Uncharacterized protein n=1 Tax=Caudovirales sp. ctTqA28 TaxID=2826775 RepID=A0A8S5MD67_9CAUD|nr:MAG TPA: hypothetical protein [Caudovirales sp. ctTqA28]